MDYQRHYDRLILKATNRQLDCYTESHHIIPRCLGGDDSKENLVRLTAEEHYIAHLLLVKIYPDHHGLVWAAIQMTGQPNGKRAGNKMYGWLKRRYQQVAKARVGTNNSQFGTMWICNIEEKVNRKISKEENIPDGWSKGRSLWNKKPKSAPGRKNRIPEEEALNLLNDYENGMPMDELMVKYNKNSRQAVTTFIYQRFPNRTPIKKSNRVKRASTKEV